MRKICLFFLFFSCFIFSQTIKEVDEFLESSKVLINDGKRKEAVKLLDKSIKASFEIHYTKGIVNGYYGKSYCLYYDRDFYSSIKYAQMALQQDLSTTTYYKQANIYHLLGQNFAKLGLNNEAISSYKKMIQVAELISDKEVAIYEKNVANNDLASMFWENKKDMDSAYYYMSKIYKDLSNYNGRSDKLNTLLSKATTGIAMLNSLNGRKDSAQYYFDKGSTYIPKKVILSPENNILNHHLTYIYLANNQNEKAKEANRLFIENAEKTQNMEGAQEGYGLKYKISAKINDSVNAFKDLKKYVEVNDSLQNIDQKTIKASYLNIIQDKNLEINKKSKKSRYFFSAIIFMTLLLIYIWYYLNKSIQKTSNEKKEALLEKETEIIELESKINLAFEELVLLAQSNSPNFLTRFQEVYPDFYKKIAELDPNIRNSELTFCAYLFLGFSTKDIANYTFVATDTVQVRKYRLRKKFNIPSDKDLYVWIKNLDV